MTTRETTKDVSIGDKRFQIGKMTPMIGSRISNLLISGAITQAGPQQTSSTQTSKNGLSPEDYAKGAVGALWLVAASALSEEVYSKIQRDCLLLCSEYIEGGPPVPVFTREGRWASKSLEQDAPAVNKLILETLQFNIAPFFLESASSLAGQVEDSSQPSLLRSTAS